MAPRPEAGCGGELRAAGPGAHRHRREPPTLAAGDPGLDGFDQAEPVAAEGGGRHDLVGALNRLPHMQRRTVVLRHWVGLSVAETAVELGISEGTVKSHTSRALERLHHILSAEPTEEGRPR